MDCCQNNRMLRQCPSGIAQQPPHHAIAVSTAMQNSHKNSVHSSVVGKQLEQKKSNSPAQLHLPVLDLFWASFFVSVQLISLLLISSGLASSWVSSSPPCSWSLLGELLRECPAHLPALDLFWASFFVSVQLTSLFLISSGRASSWVSSSPPCSWSLLGELLRECPAHLPVLDLFWASFFVSVQLTSLFLISSGRASSWVSSSTSLLLISSGRDSSWVSSSPPCSWSLLG